MLGRIYTVQVQDQKYVLGHADDAVTTCQLEVDQTDQERIYLSLKI